MPNEVIIALITVGGTMLSAFFGVIVANRLSNYRICQLEKKVEIHNNAVTRITILEQACKSTDMRVEKLEHKLE